MIQRIQSVFLLLVGILMGITIFSPLMILSDGKELLLTLWSFGVGDIFNIQYPTWGVVTLAVICTVLPIANIFLYKKRKVQMKVGTITSLFILFLYVTIYVYFNAITNKDGLSLVEIQYGAILPFIALILNILAILRIKKDEDLVRSTERIR